MIKELAIVVAVCWCGYLAVDPVRQIVSPTGSCSEAEYAIYFSIYGHQK